MTNPFTSRTYVGTWLKHFKVNKRSVNFDSIEGIRFYKHRFLPYYVNVGKNLTKGLHYTINYEHRDYKRKTLLIYDVPEYFDVRSIDTTKTRLRCKNLFQYYGFALDFHNYPQPNDYISSRISKKNRSGYKSRLRRLEECFNINYEFIYGELDEDRFKHVFSSFNELLTKRFSEKQTNYHHLESKKWNFYFEVVFKMIQKKKASIFVINNDTEPIGINLNFHSEDITFVAITVFDTDYYKFNLGKILMVKELEWCYNNGFKIMDLSKGSFDFKYEWCNLIYKFNYHVLYDGDSYISRITADGITAYFKFKLFLREKKVNELYRKCLHHVKHSNQDRIIMRNLNLEYVDVLPTEEQLTRIDMEKDPLFRKILFSYLFINPEPISGITCYSSSSRNTYYIKGKEKTQRVIISS